MNDYAIDVSALCIDHGELVLSEGSSVTHDDLLDWLRERRVAAVAWPAERGSVFFAVAHDAEGAIQLVDEGGALAGGMPFAGLRTELADAGFGIDVALTCALLDPDAMDPEADASDVHVELPDDLGQGTVYALTENGFEAVEDAEWPEEPRSQVWEFSHRGPSYAEVDALINRHPITVEVCDGWSAFGYLEPETERRELPPARGELPLITVHLVEAADGYDGVPGWVEVKTKARSLFGGYYFSLRPESPTTFPDAGGEAGRLLAVIANSALAPDSEENAIIADATLAVDAAGLHAALAPSDADPLERFSTLLRALGVPATLVDSALHDMTEEERRIVEPRSALSHLAAIADGGMRGLTPLNRELTVWERANDALLARPSWGIAFAALEMGLGAAWLAKSTRSSGTTRVLGVLGSLLVLGDGALDAGLGIRRLRRRTRDRS